jgi:signal transduction histidine kinase
VHYRGPDRRGLIVASDRVVAPHLTATSLLALLVLVVLLVGPPPGLERLDARRLASSLEGATFASAVVVAGLCLLRWRLVGEAAALYLGVASGVYAGLVVAPSVLTGDRLTTGLGPGAVPAGGRLVVVVLVVLAATRPEVDAGLRAWRLTARSAAAAAVVTAVVTVLPAVADPLLTPAEQGENGIIPTAATGTGALALWIALGGCLAWTAHRRRRPLLAWFAVGILVLAAAAANAVWRDGGGPEAVLGTLALQLVAFAFIGSGAIREVFRAFRDTDGRLLRWITEARTAETRLLADLEERRERAHEAQNILTAIQGATTALERYRDQLDPDERAALSSSISSEVQRLSRLVEATAEPAETGRFRPSEAIAPLVTCLSAEVTDLHVDVPYHLIALGRATDTLQVVHNVLENARRYGGGRITVRATLEHDQVVLRISDLGPGIAVGQEEAIFERGVRGHTSAGTDGGGLGLFISRELMRKQGGDLRLARPDDACGAAFEIVLPGFSSLLRDDAVDQLEDLRQATAARRSLRLVPVAARGARHTARSEEEDVTSDAIAQ